MSLIGHGGAVAVITVAQRVLRRYWCCLQACWRGYILRKRLTLALSYAKPQDSDDDLEGFDEVNLGDFDFNVVRTHEKWHLHTRIILS